MPSEYRPSYPVNAQMDLQRCKAAVPNGGREMGFHQCSRRPWKDGWCKQHHPDSEKARRDASMERYERYLDSLPTVRQAREIECLRAINADLLAACEQAYSDLVEQGYGDYPTATLLQAAIAKARAEE